MDEVPELPVLKAIAAALLFLVALLGATCVHHLSGKKESGWVGFCNAVAGGVLISVAIVHMLSDNAERVDRTWGRHISRVLNNCRSDGECDAFPLGFALLVLGLYLLMAIETFLPGQHCDSACGAAAPPKGLANGVCSDPLCDAERGREPLLQRTDPKLLRKVTGSAVAGVGVLAGVSVHSFVEAVAMGSSNNTKTFSLLFLAVLLHKGFAAFAVASSLVRVFQGRRWWFANLCFASTTVAGVALGAVVSHGSSGVLGAALQCFVSGTLLAVGLHDMLIPALMSSPQWRVRKLLGSLAAALAMSLLAEWA